MLSVIAISFKEPLFFDTMKCSVATVEVVCVHETVSSPSAVELTPTFCTALGSKAGFGGVFGLPSSQPKTANEFRGWLSVVCGIQRI